MLTFPWKLCVLLLAFFLLSIGSSAQSGGTFKNPPIIPTATDPTGIATADVNHDGKPDIVYLDGTTSFAIHVLLGNGDGTFTRGQDLVLPTGLCCAITLADVTGDGKLDVVVQGNVNTEALVAALVGNGDGTFQPPVTTAFQPGCCGNFPRFHGPAAVGDVNGDGKADLLLDDILNGALYLLTGDNSGKFTFSKQIQTETEGIAYLADLNGDHHLDIVATDNLGARFLVYLGNGDGTFQTFVSYSGQPGTGTLLLADLDGDGHPDMIAQWFPSSFGYFKGNSDGTFAPLQIISSVSNTNPLVLVNDFNGDGEADLNFTTPTGIGIQLTQGSLSYAAQQMSVSGGPSTIYVSLAEPVAADFNADGKLDLAMPVEGGIAILMGNGNGTFASADFYDVGEIVGAAAVADFNSDGFPDVAVTVSAPFPKLLLGNGSGAFKLATDQNLSYGSQTPAAFLVAGDFNGDKKIDVSSGPASLNVTNSVVSVAFGAGNGTFSTPKAVTNGTSVVADFNRDGRSDMADIDGNTIIVSLGQAGETFTSVSTDLRIPNATGLYNAGDVNNDGIPDLVLNYFDHLEIWTGNGDGTFAFGSSINVSQILSNVVAAIADVDGDGNRDIVLAPDPAAGSPFGPLVILYGNGDGTFQTPASVVVSHRYSQVVVADLNGDKKPDLVMTDGGSVAVLINQGNRTFANEVDYVAGGQVSALSVSDVNGDGLPDIVAANPGGTTVTVLLNQKNGSSGGNSASGVLSVSPEPSVFSQTITLSLVLSGNSAGAATPTGTVSFSVDGNLVATVAVAKGTASYAYVNQMIPTPHTIIAVYNGDKIYASQSFSLQHVVKPPTFTTTTALTATPATILTSQTVRLVATVTCNPPVPAGEVSFYDGSKLIGAATLNSSGVAFYDVAVLATGKHSLIATYDGFSQPGFMSTNQAYTAAIYSMSSSVAVSVAVNADATTTTVSFSPASPTTGQVVTLTAQVASSAGVPFGGVTFADGATVLGTSGLQSNGSANFSTASLTSSAHSITATFNANGPYAGSTSSPASIVISAVKANSTPAFVSLTLAQDALNSGTTLSAFVSTAGAKPPARVTFLDSGAILGTVPVEPGGVATLRVAPLASGTHNLTASFTATNNTAHSVSPALIDAWPSAGPGFNIGVSSNTLNVGSSGRDSVTISVDAVGQFEQSMQLSCAAGLPAGYSCDFSPDHVQSGGMSILTIHDSEASARLFAQPVVLLCSLLLALGLFYSRSPNRFPLVIQAGILLCTIAVLSSCASLPSTASSRTSVITVRAASGSGNGAIVHNAQLCVTFSSKN
jgi:Bacterial Ig-like domain (group 3)/FG-GAP-like repeat/FG-GAP repeat